MHKIQLLIYFLFISYLGQAEGLKIITSDGRQGIADSNGEVVIPPIYELLGWSNGMNNILDQSIGYRENGKWGLINIKNKKITNARYCLLKPFSSEAIEAGILGRFSNMVFRGLIDASANTLLEFRYFSLLDAGNHHVIVSEFRDGTFKYGLYTDTNQRVIPLEFASVKKMGNLYAVQNELNKVMLYDANGKAVLDHWMDHIALTDAGYILHNNGYIGLADASGASIHPVTYKSIGENGLMAFAEWEVVSLKDKSRQKISCDSLEVDKENDLLIAHVNNADHILGASKLLFENQEHMLKHLGNGFLVTKNSKTGSWGVYKTNGSEMISGMDTIAVDEQYFYTQKAGSWDIYNLFGRKVNPLPLQKVGASQGSYIPVKRNDYWGWIDFQGNKVIDPKFDEIISTNKDGAFLANYLNKWGVNTFTGNWLILPEYDKITSYGDFYLGKKQDATYIINDEGKVIDRTGYHIQFKEYLQLVDEGHFGAIAADGTIIEPIYDQVELIGDYLKCKRDGFVTLIDREGRHILKPEDQVQDVYAYSEGYFHILKNDKHGFVDENGKLRIANRYDGALPYNEGLAPVQLLGKWGFITKAETLIIQPFYQNSSTFKNGLAIIQNAGNYGVIDKEGKEVIRPAWKHIERLHTGNYLITDWNDHKGIANDAGRIIARPTYDHIEDTSGNLFIATRNGLKGVFDYSGYKKVDFLYKDIRIEGDYMLLRR